VNLATARSTKRAKEVGIRKVLGGQRSNLIWQLLTESLLMTTLSFILSIALLELISGGVGAFKFKHVNLLVIGGITTLVVGIVNGIYPAILLSSFHPVQALRGHLRIGSASGFRKVSVVFQFSVSIILLVVTLVAFQQVHHERYKDIGFNQNDIIALDIGHDSVREKYDAFQAELLKDSRIFGVTASSAKIGIRDDGMIQIRGDGLQGERAIHLIRISPDFVRSMGLHLVEGIDVSKGQMFLLNQKALERFEWTSATGRALELFTKQQDIAQVVYSSTVAGVVNDFQFHMLLNIQPIVLVVDHNRANYILIRTNPGQMRAVLPYIEGVWKQWFPDRTVKYTLLSEARDLQYETFEIIVGLFSTVNILAIFIACLGLFGLTAFNIDRRIKEIGIRKVMGASVFNISKLLSQEFICWVGIAVAIACPIAYVGIDFVLNKLPTRTDQNPLSYIGGILIAFVLALATINILAIRAARANPIDALRSE
jgi:putative ABC transport system permease protein